MPNEKVGGLEMEAEIDVGKLGKGLKDLSKVLDSLDGVMKKTEKGLNSIEKAGDGAGKKVGLLQGTFTKLAGAFAVGNLATRAAFAIQNFFTNLVKGSISASSALTELDSKARVVFGESFPRVQTQVKAIAAEVGRASTAVLQFATDMGAVIDAFGISGPLLDEMSTQLAKLAVDLASFHNKSDEDAFMALRSGLTGETEPLKRFGIVLTDTNLQLFALEKGIKRKVEAMNQAQKTALRYAFIMDVTSKAQGDAARTADTFANQSRRLSGELQTLQEQMGKAATPVLADMLGFLSSVIQNTRLFINLLIQDIQSLTKAMGSIPGMDSPLVKGTLGVMKKVGGFALDPFGANKFLLNRIGGRIEGQKEPEASTAATLDPLKDFEKLGGVTKDAGKAAADAAEKIEKLEGDILKAFQDQAKANQDRAQTLRDELELRQKLGVLTSDEEKMLTRLNRRTEFQRDVVDEATQAWEEQADEIKRVEDRVQDLIEKIKEEQRELVRSIKDINDEARGSKVEKAAELAKEMREIEQEMAQGGISGEQRGKLEQRRREIEALMDPLRQTEEGQSILREGDTLSGLNEFELIDRKAEIRKQEAVEKSRARMQELQAELDAENKKLDQVKAAEAEKRQIVVNALNDRLIQTQLNFKLVEEATEAHIKTQIEQYNRLRASVTAAVPSTTTPIRRASGGLVSGPGGPTEDRIHALLSNNEFVQPAAAVSYYGQTFMEAIRTMRLPRFADGGLVTNNKSATINITNHGRAAEVYANPRHARWHSKMFLG